MMFGDFPLAFNTELYFQHPLMSVQGWDYYSWQLYRGNAGDPGSYTESSDLFLMDGGERIIFEGLMLPV